MSAHYAHARRCQLLQRDLHGVLLLASRLCYTADDDSDSDSTTKATTRTSSAARACVAGLLTEAHVRGLVVDTLVRVAVPRSKRDALLLRNPYVQHADAQRRALAESKRNNNNSVAAPAVATTTHRVGRVVALLPKPSKDATTTTTTQQQQQQHDGDNNSSSSSSAAALWLVAVHFGECVELVAVRYVSDDAFSEDEHEVYMSSTLGTHVTHANLGSSSSSSSSTATGAMSAGNDGSGRAAVLSVEHAMAVQQTLQDVRTALRMLYVTTTTADAAACVSLSVAAARAAALWGHRHVAHTQRAEAATTSSTTSAALSSVSVKRQRDESVTTTTARVKSERTDDDDDDAAHAASQLRQTSDEGDALSSPSLAFASSSQQQQQLTLMLQRTRDEAAQMRTQLQRLRTLLNTRDAELVRSVQQQRHADEQHTRALAQWRNKLEEESATRTRMHTEMTQTMQQQQTLLEQANVKLRRLAEMTSKYKAVVDELRAQLCDDNNNNTGGVTAAQLQRPEAILAELRRRRGSSGSHVQS